MQKHYFYENTCLAIRLLPTKQFLGSPRSKFDDEKQIIP